MTTPARFLALGSIAGVVMMIGLAASSGAQDVHESSWPRQIDTPEARIVVYQPQPDSLRGNTLWGRSALSITPAGKSEPIFGAAWFVARLETDRDVRTATVLELQVPHVRLPHSKPEEEARLLALLEREAPKWELKISLDHLMAGLEVAEQEQEIATGLDNKPPRIVWETVPAILVSFDGEPRAMAVKDWNLDRVVNTPFLILRDHASNTFYLQGGKRWFAAPAASGPWSSSTSTPTEVEAYAAQQESNPSADSLFANQDERTPKIVVATEPTELVVTDGEPEWTPIAGDELVYISNTESDVFRDIATQEYYVLFSGRWFRASSLKSGPWTFVRADTLPAAFLAIAAKSSKSDVLVNVAGTQQAQDALLDAQIPQTAAIERDAARLVVQYDGPPRFEKIPGANIDYATNTGTSVLRIDDRYYACDQGVWFVSDTANGPWQVADSVPNEVQRIPPECPVYNVKYVRIYEVTPTVVYVGYTPGYVGCYPYYGTVVYGTGWHYRPWYGTVYYPRPVTWGWNAHYSPWTGWCFGMSWGAGWASWSNDWIGQPGGWWGPCGYYPWRPSYVWGYRPPPPGWRYRPVSTRPGYRAPHARRAYNPPPRPVSRNVYNMGDNRLRNGQLTRVPRPTPSLVRNRPNDVYTDRDGNVYRRTASGWQRRDRGTWRPAPTTRPAEPVTRPEARPEVQPAPRPAEPATRPPRTEPPPAQSTPQTAPRPAPAAPQTAPRPAPAAPQTAPRPAPSAPQPAPRPAETAPQPTPRSAAPATPPAPSGPAGLERDFRARQHGAERARDFEKAPVGGGKLKPAPKPSAPEQKPSEKKP